MTFAELLERHRPIAAPGAYDALSARVIAQAGYPLVYVTGLGNEASDLGLPDLGFATATEVVRHRSRPRRGAARLPARRVARGGVRMVVYWHLPLFAALRAVHEAVSAPREDGCLARVAERVAGYREYARATDLEAWQRLGDDG